MIDIFILITIALILDIILMFFILINDYLQAKNSKSYFITTLITFSLFFIIFSFFAPHVYEKLIDVTTNLRSDLNTVASIHGNLMNPYIAISAALLTFLAFWIQYKANNKIAHDSNDTKIHKIYSDRLNLIIKEIDNFSISFHGNKLIKNLDDLSNNESDSKKYNFSGVQGLHLFLLEFKDEITNNDNYRKADGSVNYNVTTDILNKVYFSQISQINNLIVFFANTIDEIYKIKLQDDPEEIIVNDLKEILFYIYTSKFTFLIEIYLKYDFIPSDSLLYKKINFIKEKFSGN